MQGTVRRPGQNGSSRKSAPAPAGPSRPLTDAELAALLDEVCFGNGVCGIRDSVVLNPRIPVQPPPKPNAAGAAATPALTITDLARFLPAAAALHAEPDGWAVVGVPANFWVDASPVTASGELLGQPVQVRFTPQAYRFDYGDGTIRTSPHPGASWAALGQKELTETPTSHTFTARGDLRAQVTVVYSAQYRLADGAWTAVSGAVSGTAPSQRVLVVVERTALTTPA